MLPIYCVNLAKRPDRWQRMEAIATKAGLDLTRIEAVNADQAAAVQAEEGRDGNPTIRSLDPLQAAAILSHMKCWRTLVETGEDRALILEDDVLFADGLGALLDEAPWPDGADIIRLEVTSPLVTLQEPQVIGSARRTIGRLAASVCGTGGYLISRAAAQRLLDGVKELSRPIDLMLFTTESPWFSELAILQLVPAPIVQGDMLAETAQEGWAETSVYSKRPERTMVRHAGTVAPKRSRSAGGAFAASLRDLVRRVRGRQRFEMTFG